jgi:hypothetical protein
MQVGLLLTISIVVQVILVRKPGVPFMIIFTEFMVSLYLYLLLCLTDFLGTMILSARDLIGWALTAVVTVTVAANLLKLLKSIKYAQIFSKLKARF